MKERKVIKEKGRWYNRRKATEFFLGFLNTKREKNIFKIKQRRTKRLMKRNICDFSKEIEWKTKERIMTEKW